jgi:hypothetical protein
LNLLKIDPQRSSVGMGRKQTQAYDRQKRVVFPKKAALHAEREFSSLKIVGGIINQ